MVLSVNKNEFTVFTTTVNKIKSKPVHYCLFTGKLNTHSTQLRMLCTKQFYRSLETYPHKYFNVTAECMHSNIELYYELPIQNNIK